VVSSIRIWAKKKGNQSMQSKVLRGWKRELGRSLNKGRYQKGNPSMLSKMLRGWKVE
jgi:hypothetical protein